MKVWLDAQLSPALAPWMSTRFGLEVHALVRVGLRDATDTEVYFAARAADAVVMTKDSDFVDLSQQHGPPPRIVWVTIGNTSNAAFRLILESAWPRIALLLQSGEPLVELQAKV